MSSVLHAGEEEEDGTVGAHAGARDRDTATVSDTTTTSALVASTNDTHRPGAPRPPVVYRCQSETSTPSAPRPLLYGVAPGDPRLGIDIGSTGLRSRSRDG